MNDPAALHLNMTTIRGMTVGDVKKKNNMQDVCFRCVPGVYPFGFYRQEGKAHSPVCVPACVQVCFSDSVKCVERM